MMIPYEEFLVRNEKSATLDSERSCLLPEQTAISPRQMNIPNHLPHNYPIFVICRKIINSILVSPPNLSDMPIATQQRIHFMGIWLQFGILIVRLLN
jgi:hypothetical protein